MSRASLREARRTFETLRLIRTEPGRGTLVVPCALAPSAALARWHYARDAVLLELFEVRLMDQGAP